MPNQPEIPHPGHLTLVPTFHLIAVGHVEEGNHHNGHHSIPGCPWGQSYKDFLHLRTNLQVCSKARKQCGNTNFCLSMLEHYTLTYLLDYNFLYH